MKDLLIMLADMISFDEQLEMLKDGIEKYEQNPTEENKKNIYMHCMMMAAKHASDEVGGADKLIDRMNLHDRASKLLIPGENS